MANYVDCFRPKIFRRIIVLQHGPCQGDEYLVLPFNDSVLLRCVCGGELMLDAFFIAPRVKVHIVELGAVVSSDLDDVEAKLPLTSSCKGLKELQYLAFLTKKQSPSIPCKIINNNKTI